MRKTGLLLFILAFTILLSACAPTFESGPPRPSVRPDRAEQLGLDSQKPSYDISAVVSFVDEMNVSLPLSEHIKDYDTSYDEKTATVYLSTDDATIAFKMDADGNVAFASCTGSPSIKSELSHSIARAIMYGGDSPVEQLFGQIEEKIWLNELNMDVVRGKMGSSISSSLDTQMPDWTLNTSGELDTAITMPTITNELERVGLKDLSDYFESPTLPKFWSGIDRDDMLAEIGDYGKKGEAFKDFVMPNKPELTSPDISNLLPDSVKDALLKKELKHASTNLGNGKKPELDVPALPSMTLTPNVPTLPPVRREDGKITVGGTPSNNK